MVFNTTPKDLNVYYLGDNGVGITLYITQYDENTQDYIAVDLTDAKDDVYVYFVNINDSNKVLKLTFSIINATNGEIRCILNNSDVTTQISIAPSGSYYIISRPEWPISVNYPSGKKFTSLKEKSEPNLFYIREHPVPANKL